MAEFKEFPKMLTKGTECQVVNDQPEEDTLAKDGWTAPETAHGPQPEKPKPCAKCKELTDQVTDLEAQLALATAPAAPAAKAK